MAVPGNGEKAKEEKKSMDPVVLGHLWALNKVNQALLIGLESAAHTMEHWDQLSEESRQSMIVSIKGLIEHGKGAFASIPDMGPGDAEAVKH